jgi:hypothetical protein
MYVAKIPVNKLSVVPFFSIINWVWSKFCRYNTLLPAILRILADAFVCVVVVALGKG